MSKVCSFPPIAGEQPGYLILGSMPGIASLEAGQYYAHPRNQFWPILCRVLGVNVPPDYRARVTLLQDNGIALWDVLASCIRPGSLDSAIAAEVANDFPAFLAVHGSIRMIGFNGQKAQTSFQKLVLPQIDAGRYDFHTLPSTSPANASYTLDRKYQIWSGFLRPAAK